MAAQLESLRRVCDRDPASVEADAVERKSPRHLIGWSYRQGGWRGHIVQGTGLGLINDMVVRVIGAFAGETFSFTPRSSAHARRRPATSSSSDSSGVPAAGAAAGGVVDAAAAGSPRAEDG